MAKPKDLDLGTDSGGRVTGGFVTEPMAHPREAFQGAKAPGAAAAAEDLRNKIPNELIENVMKSAETLLGPGPDAPPPAPVRVTTADGFENTIAQEVFEGTGQLDAAKRVDELVNLLGVRLYEQLGHYARNAGLNNEADWVRQLIGEVIAREELQEINKPFEYGDDHRTQQDDKAGSPGNQQIEKWFGKTVLGAVRGRARDLDVTNITVLKALVHKALMTAKRRGLCADYSEPPRQAAAIGRDDVFEVVLEMFEKMGLGVAINKMLRQSREEA